MDNFQREYVNLLPRAKFHKGQKLITTEFYAAHPKMSLTYKVPKQTIVEVLETLFADDMCDVRMVRVKNRTIGSFEFCLPEDILLPVIDLDRLLYV